MEQEYSPEQLAKASSIAAAMTDAQKAALRRFDETCADEGTYDISKAMRSELSKLGLIQHRGGGYFRGTALYGPVLKYLEDRSLSSNT